MTLPRNSDASMHHRVFESVDPVAITVDNSKPYARNFIQLGGPASDKLSELVTDLRGTSKRLSSRMATGLVNRLLSTVGLPSPEMLADQMDAISTATARFVRSCIKLLTFSDDLRFLKDSGDLHSLLGDLFEAWDMLDQMQSDMYVMRNAAPVYKMLDRMTDEIVKVKDFGGKTGGELAGLASSGKSRFWGLIHGKQAETTTTTPEPENPDESISTATPRLRETLASINDQWPDLLKAIAELNPHLEEMAEKVNVALEVK